MAFWHRAAGLAILAILATWSAAGAQKMNAAEAMKEVDAALQGRVQPQAEAKAATPAQPEIAPPLFDFRSAVAEIQQAERLVTAALQTGDSAELRSIENKLIRLESRILEAKPGDYRVSCGLAAGDLASVGSSMRRVMEGDEPARHLVSAETIEAAYRRHIAECERAIRASERRARR